MHGTMNIKINAFYHHHILHRCFVCYRIDGDNERLWAYIVWIRLSS